MSQDVIVDDHTITEQSLRSTEMDSDPRDVISKLLLVNCLSSISPNKSSPGYTDSSVIPVIPLFNPASVSVTFSLTTA